MFELDRQKQKSFFPDSQIGIGFINFLHKLTHTHRYTAAAKPKTFVFAQRMLPKSWGIW
jgi:hypothetical protein